MGRKKSKGQRTASGRLSRSAEALADRNPPADYVIARRNLFAFVTPTKGPEGRTGTIDQDICDGIGQLHALGLLDNPHCDAQDMRDKGREWRNHYCKLLRASGYKTGGYERMDKGVNEVRYTGTDARFDQMDSALTGFERSCLLSLLVDPVVGSWPDGNDNAPWVESLIGEALLKRGKIVQMLRFPDSYDRSKLEAVVRGLCWLVGQQMQRAA